ncbi:hypothetical protein ACFQDG_09810 [Natronoarchaeum mannanilyticum]|uniref:DUF485 domain-containing protein n=1 Tax=Natronoarchaeum mannanilyticum TaxID=926360 RepID=A0AAV3TAN6_9EURY
MSRDRRDADGESASSDESAFGAPAEESADEFGAASDENSDGFGAASNPDFENGEPSDGSDKDQLVAFARELGVERNVKWALALGAAFAALLYVVFVVIPAETTQSPVLYLGLAFVVFFATSLSLTILFTAVSAWRRAREL